MSAFKPTVYSVDLCFYISIPTNKDGQVKSISDLGEVVRKALVEHFNGSGVGIGTVGLSAQKD